MRKKATPKFLWPVLVAGMLLWWIPLGPTSARAEEKSETSVEPTTVSRKYRFKLLTECGEGWFPSINNLGEIVYEKYDSDGNPNVFSTTRGWLTYSTTGGVRFPDINDRGEVVYADHILGLGFALFSTERGLIATEGNKPSISNTNEIVYWRAYYLPYQIISTTRGVLYSSYTGRTLEFAVNDYGEVVYIDLDEFGRMQIFSTERGQITFLSAYWPISCSIKSDGEIIYDAADNNGVRQIFSTVHGQLIGNNSFPEPLHVGPWTGEEEFGWYSTGIGTTYPDVNDNGEIVFVRGLAEGPYFDERLQEYYGIGCLRLYLAEPVVQVEIDIKPCSDLNSVNLKSKGVLPVAVLTTDDFDAYNVYPDTCTFADADLERWTMEDVDNDGDRDMLFHFRTQELNLDGDSTEATLEGETTDGNPIMGTDTVNIIPKGPKNK